ncbi:aminotransferase class I/II-fold pyridoxal phosphate-dependent enzyme [Hydrogenophaga sp. SNF1]|uniref:histidinol-phosphate transaminase n=1 Tax=Hydrogenophaga borbori TaxID=2294117 RepID=A0A372ENQ9_9BURK|nr:MULTISPECIES: aminotransferase class I/II-fold pyridoxal phosphate-dependent enzyme [Hydrogenophaga]RFP81307.1 aminotransferase class I/II-fold pyridoxal phosphate-dependent enzyme [Hydrogenophaga borbori]WQB85765.1 aminotransferase class I/II-fold pyridoxal phosphate-dependent enzyme [Hydrogenophaga sp. SNF1]
MSFPTPAAHGGPDALGAPAHDFSTNANALGPCPMALLAIARADASRYPDPASTRLKAALADFHGVAPERLLLLASASEGIQRFSAWAARTAGACVWLPPHHYGDLSRAAGAWGLVRTDDPGRARLLWACEPSSPLGQAEAGLAERVVGLRPDQALVLDQAYAPLRLSGAPSLDGAALDRVWRLVSPNKALGLTGVRGAYAIAPLAARQAMAELEALAPSWPLGAHAEAMLMAWTAPDTQRWLGDGLDTLREWKAAQAALCESLGWTVLPSEANYFVARLSEASDIESLPGLRRDHGVKLRDAASFGLPGQVRLGVRSPEDQAALRAAWPRARGGDNSAR